MTNGDLNEEAQQSRRGIRRRPFWWQVVMLAAISALAGCGGSAGDGGNGGTIGGVVSCTLGEQTPIGTLMICEEASGLDATMTSNFQMDCVVPPGSADAGIAFDAHFAHAPCSRVGALGGCRVQMGTVTVTGWYYNVGSTSTSSSSEIQSLCNTIGATFIAP
jgi:hypothetical protein